ncbi:MAG: 2-oxoacid:ferredoxin oxidoreductase subunit beta [Ectothiorhodospiraceae bacterium]|jgi:2-oxoglutarate ferredoxin oxidoreductase subunit beta
MEATAAKARPADFASDQQVRWCPGCGDYAILKSLQRMLAQADARRENQVFVSGIGCSSRLPYYMDTYGFHTIHGRAPAVASGVKLANPGLDVWVITGDGDGLSIGGNHLLHALRRNLNLQILLFNNEIYGLTKGQFSPTSRPGTRSPSTPDGSVDAPVAPVAFALGAGAPFVARAVDNDQTHLPEILRRAYEYGGAAFVEIFQNCIVYNDAVFGEFTDRDVSADRQLHLRHGEPMIFGADRDRGIRLNPRTLTLDVVMLGEGSASEEDVLVHDETNPLLANLLGAMQPPEFPVAMGVLYRAPETGSYDERLRERGGRGRPAPDDVSLNALLRGGATWTVRS